MPVLGFELVPPPVQRGDTDAGSNRRIAASGRLLLLAAVVLACSGPAAGSVVVPDGDAPELSASDARTAGQGVSQWTPSHAITAGRPLPSLATGGKALAQNGSAGNENGTAGNEPAQTDSPRSNGDESTTATTDTVSSPSTETETSTASATATEASTPTETATATATESQRGTATPTATPTDDEETVTPSPTADAAFAITSVSAPEAVRAGEDVSVTAAVTNRGTTSATGRVNYSLAGRTADSERLSLDAGASTRVTFTGSTAGLDPGTYVHGVRNATGAGVAHRLRVTPDVDVTVQGMDAPTEISRGDPYVVLATVDNPAGTAITRNVSYAFDGVTVATKRVTVGGGASERVAFEIETDDLERAAGPIANGSTHTHAVVADGGSRDGGEVLVRRGAGADPSALAVQEFRASDDLRPGETMTVNVSVRNVDDAVFEGQLAYRINGSAVDTEWVRVPVDERQTVAFTVTHDALDRRGVLGAPGETDHGVWVGETALQTRPLTVHGPFATPTPTDAATFTDSSDRASGDREQSDGPSDDRTETDSCERGLLSPCGGTGFDETTLTLIGIATSMVGILYEMTSG